jgi:integrase
MDRGEQPITIIAPEKCLCDLLDRYEKEISIRKRSVSDHFHIRQIKRHPIASCFVRELRPSLVAKFRNDRLTQVAPATVIKELSILRQVIAIGVQEWSLDSSLALVGNVRNPSPPRSRSRRLNDGEISELLSHFRDLKNPVVSDLVEFALETAMRRGEMIDLFWRDVDWDKKTVFISLSKNGDSRTIPLSPAAETVLVRIMNRQRSINAESKIFPLTKSALRMAWVRAIKKLEIQDFKFHDLRHESISRFVELGLNLAEVALISGHRDIRMLFRYTHLKPYNVGEKIREMTKS